MSRATYLLTPAFVRLLVTVRKRGCRKVMFSEACVKNSVRGRGVGGCVNGLVDGWS